MTGNKAIICMAAGPSQVLVIKKAKEMGFKVIAVDQNPEAVGFELADDKIITSTYEPEPIINHLRKLTQYELMGVINRSSGPPVVTTAVINEALHLPGIKPEIAGRIVSKHKLIRICTERNIPVALCQSVQKLPDVSWDEIKYPSVIKPSLSLVGKSGVRVIWNSYELKEAFQESKELSYDGYVNIEEYIAGHDVSLMAVVNHSELLPVVLLDELNCKNNKLGIYGAGFAIPSIFTGSVEESRILNLARDIVNKLGLKNTPFLMSCLCEKGGFPHLIEVHLDMGGDLVLDELLPVSSSFDFIKYAIKILTGHTPAKRERFFSPAAIIYEKGEGLVSERPFKIIKADSRNLLDEDIKNNITAACNSQAAVEGIYK